MAGDVTLTALVEGDLARPRVTFKADGQGIASPIRGHAFSLGRFEAVGTFNKGDLEINRAYMDTPEGLITVHGVLGSHGNIGLAVVARGLLPAAYDPRMSGQVNLVATIGGTLKRPTASGRIEGYELTYDLPPRHSRGYGRIPSRSAHVLQLQPR